jgi:hypothetical protein
MFFDRSLVIVSPVLIYNKFQSVGSGLIAYAKGLAKNVMAAPAHFFDFCLCNVDMIFARSRSAAASISD